MMILHELPHTKHKRIANRNGGQKSMSMSEAAKAARREYKKKWQRDNADKVKEYQRRYWDKKAREAAAAGDLPQENGTTQEG